jgi:hypothetical protein
VTEHRLLQKLLRDAKVDKAKKESIFAKRSNYRLKTVMSNTLFQEKFSNQITQINLSNGATMKAHNVRWLGDTMTYEFRYASLLLNREISFETEFRMFSEYVPSVYEVDLDSALLEYFSLVYNSPPQPDPNAVQADGARARHLVNLLSE